MKRKTILFLLSIFFLGYAEKISASNSFITNGNLSKLVANPPFEFNLDPGFTVIQTVNQPGLVVISGSLTKPFTSDHVKLSIKYQDSSGNWVTGWCKILYSYNQYNENLVAKFELPASTNSSYNLKIDLSSDSNITNWSMINWNKDVKHYKSGDYSTVNCDLDENEYTILLTPKKNGTLILDANNKVTSIKDRVTSIHSWNKLSNILMNNKKDNVLFTPKNPANLVSEPNGIKAVNIVNQGAISDTLAATPEFIYNEMPGHPIPYLHSYDDPVYIFAGKFSVNGFLMKFSQYPLDPDGPGYHNFKNPNALQSRYFNTYNTISEKLSDFIADQEPVVFVSSVTTGFRVYKSNGTYINLTGYSNYGGLFFGYGNDQAGGRRGPGSENFKISNTNEMTLYGMGALRNNITPSSQTVRSLQDIEIEIKKFIKYTGVFSSSSAYNDISECAIGCFEVNSGANPDNTVLDWTKAPNSYIFTGKDKNGNSVDGLYIPVKKAYAMWNSGKYIGGIGIPNGTITADVLWEDNMGLIKSDINYSLTIIGSGENAKIKVPINIVKKGNAVIAFRINGEIFWSWHIWATDDPTNGTTYKSYDAIKRELSDGTIENVSNEDWGWMDRNLGAIGNTITGDGWNKNGGLLYQWGRKDPIPPLVTRGDGFYEVTGTIGKILHRNAKTQTAGYLTIDNLTKYVSQTNANIIDNIRLSIKNPVSLIYVNQDGTSTQAFYNNANGVYSDVNWFGSVPGLETFELSKVNLWSDNSQGIVSSDGVTNFNDPLNAKPYRNKSSYDPCPNGWRMPSMLVAHATNGVRVDFSPFGIKTNIPYYSVYINGSGVSNIKPGTSTLSPYLQGIKVYPQYGFDMSSVGGNNMGIFPGTGMIDRRDHVGQFSDQHETYLWTATMSMWDANNLPWSTTARALRLTPDASQIVNNYKPDASNYPNVYGLYNYLPMQGLTTNRALGCRCIKDPLFVKNNYDFPTEFINDNEMYKVGIDNPNSYLATKSTSNQTIIIPVSKAFSMQSNYLGNSQILNPSNFNDLKANVLWADNPNLITQINLTNPSSKDALINVNINANQSGNAVITLHNGSISNPVYWSWHVWVTNNPVTYVTYLNDTPISTDNYVNYTQYGNIMKTKIMDRNLGATEAVPTAYNASLVDKSQGLHYQWGRKDPLPVFKNISGSGYNVYLGTTNNTGIVTYPSTLTEAAFLSGNISSYPYGISNLTSYKIDGRIEKMLSYSVTNPLKFMVPTVKYANFSDIKFNLGSDWLFDNEHHSLFSERWGWGSIKSAFDPCPEGWRVPDLTTGSLGATTRKTSPLSLNNNMEHITINGSNGQPVGNTEVGYYGSVLSNAAPGTSTWGKTVAYLFNNNLYNVGNFTKGYIRSKRSVIYGDPLNNNLNALSGGIWYSTLNSSFTGRGNYMSFDNYSRILVKNSDIDPYAAMSCRCVKQEDDNGNQRGPVPTFPVTFNTGKQATNTFSEQKIAEKTNDGNFLFYPNPVKDILHIDAKDNKEYFYQIYNMAGQKIYDGKFENGQTNLSFIHTGIYFIRINDSEQIVKIIKK